MPEFHIDVVVNPEGAVTGGAKAKEALREIGGEALELNAALELTKKGFELLKDGIELPIEQFKALVEFSSDMIQEFDTAFVASTKLEVALANAGDTTGELRAHLEELTASIKETSRLDEAQIQAGEALALTYGKQSVSLDDVLQAAKQVSSFLSIDFATAVNKVEHAMQTGNIMMDRGTQVLSTLTDRSARAAEVLDQLQKRLRGTSEAIALGGAGNLDAAARSFEDLKRAIGDVIANSPKVEAFFIELTHTFDTLTSFILANKKQFSDLFGNVFTLSLSLASKAFSLFVDIVEKGLNKLMSMMANLSTNKVAGALGFPQATGPQAEAFINARNKLEDVQSQIAHAEAYIRNADVNPADFIAFQKQKLVDLNAQLPDLISNVDKARDAMLGLGDTKDTLSQLVAQWDALKKEAAAAFGANSTKDAIAQFLKDWEELSNKIAAAHEHTKTVAGGGSQQQDEYLRTLRGQYQDMIGPLDKVVDGQRNLTDLWRAGSITGLQYATGLQELFAGTSAFEAVINETANSLDTFLEHGKFSFGDFTRSLLADMDKIIAKMIATELVLGALSIVGSALGLPSGALGTSLQIGAGHAAGGPVSEGIGYPVGERGTELFVPSRPGTIVPNGQFGRSQVVVHVINVSDPDEIPKAIMSGKADAALTNWMSRNRAQLRHLA